jgi:hypothetical protein
MLNMTNENQAVWEMTQLIIAPKKVFRNIYYHVSLNEFIPHSFVNIADNNHRNVRCKTMDYNCNQRANDRLQKQRTRIIERIRLSHICFRYSS